MEAWVESCQASAGFISLEIFHRDWRGNCNHSGASGHGRHNSVTVQVLKTKLFNNRQNPIDLVRESPAFHRVSGSTSETIALKRVAVLEGLVSD